MTKISSYILYMILQTSTCRSIEAFQQAFHHAFPGRSYINRKEDNHEKRISFLDLSVPKLLVTQTTALNSMQSLIEDLSSSTSSSTRTVFVGGKGGVGKTTVSSSLAVTLASLENNLNNNKILVVSTDPAHSLGDALDVNLKVPMNNEHNKNIVQMTDPLTMGNLYAMEVNTDAAIERFENVLSSFNVETISETYGISPDLLSSFGLDDISNLLSNPPPGLDELIALSQILNDEYIQSEFDVIVVDTAPTGHTLRMLALPEFLDGFLSKLLTLRQKLSGVINMVQTFMGAATGNANAEQFENRKQSIDTALETIEEFRTSMNTLRKTLSNDQLTNFVIVSVPTKLSVNESKRLMEELIDQKIKISDIVINQCVVGESANGGNNDAMEAMVNYYNRRKANQMKWVNELQSTIDSVSISPEYKNNGGGSIALTQVPFFDVELVGVPALAYLGSTVFNSENFKYLMDEGSEDDSKFVICGGKGGVGKTTTSSSLAVSMAATGRNVALVSTDPAHSLGDVFDQNFSGGELVEVPLIGVPYTDGSLSVLEVDPTKSLNDFKGLIDNLIGSNQENDGGMGNDMGKTLRELGDVFDTLPAGTDEVVALAKVVGLIKNGNFDRIVLDTAPTGHTLRMLSTPGFISELIEKVLSISNKINSNSMLKMMLSNAAGGSDELDEKTAAARQALVNFQFKMYDLEELFSNADQTEFLIVTVPTELAVRESVRLLNDLTYEAPDMPIKVRNVVANQVLKDDGSDVSTFLNKVADVQKSSIQNLKSAANALDSSVDITEVPYLDTEPRGVFGLKVLSGELTKETIN